MPLLIILSKYLPSNWCATDVSNRLERPTINMKEGYQNYQVN